MNYLNEELFCPNAFHRELAMQKKLANEKGELLPQYFTLSLFYRNLLEVYIGTFIGIQNLENEIKNSGLKFAPITQEDKDVYQMYSPYHYFYLRNTMYIEKLTIQDLSFLQEKLNKKDNKLDEFTKEFLKRTYPLVITSDIVKEETLTNYGPFSPDYFAPSNAIVYGIRCSDDLEATDEEWLEINFKQQKFLQEMKERLNVKMKEKLECPIYFLVYDDESIKKNETIFNKL